MKKIRIKLYKVLRTIGLQRDIINLLAISNEGLKLDRFDEAYYLNLLEDSFDILISDKDIDNLKTIDSTVYYLHLELETSKKN